MSVSPEAARAVAASTDWVIVQDVLVWLASHHVLWTGLPVAALVALVGQALVSVGRTRRGRAGDIVSLSLRDEYVLRESWARWRPRLVALVAAGFIAALGALAYISLRQ